MILVCEDANSKLFAVVTVADVEAEKRDDHSLLEIWKLKFGKILRLKSSHVFEAIFLFRL